MIEIIKFERSKNDILIGYRENNRVVYSSVPANLSDEQAKQKGYEQVRDALIYENTLEVPSIDGTKLKAIETFEPQIPIPIKISIQGEKKFVFVDDSHSVDLNYVVIVHDQYGDIYSEHVKTETILNESYTHEVSATVDDIVKTLRVEVAKYIKPQPSEIDLLKVENENLSNYLLEVDYRLILVELGL